MQQWSEDKIERWVGPGGAGPGKRLSVSALADRARPEQSRTLPPGVV